MEPMPSDRSFGKVLTSVFVLIASYQWYYYDALNIWLITAAAIALGITIFRPQKFHAMNTVWFRFGQLLQKITNPIILGAIYFVIITPTAFLARIFNKRFLHLKIDNTAQSYWIEKASSTTNLKDQF
jgi:hypothetical protein